jgi:hypothetical protein
MPPSELESCAQAGAAAAKARMETLAAKRRTERLGFIGFLSLYACRGQGLLSLTADYERLVALDKKNGNDAIQ